MPIYNIRKVNSMTVQVDVILRKGEKTFTIFNAPDAHWDNPKCDRELLTEHLNYAKSKEALIIMPGDTFCIMQGKYDPRRSKSDVRPEHNKVNYIDAVVNDAANYFAPYADNLILGNGNHETAILKNLETDILERFAGLLNKNNPVMGYHFWVVLAIYEEGSNDKQRETYKMYCNHGSGGGGPVTRGQIDFSRQLMYVEGADCISMGHIHEKNTGEAMVHFFNNAGNVYKPQARSVLMLRSSTYKQEYIHSGFHIEKGRGPKPLGGTFIDLHYNRTAKGASLVHEPRFFGTKTFDI